MKNIINGIKSWCKILLKLERGKYCKIRSNKIFGYQKMINYFHFGLWGYIERLNGMTFEPAGQVEFVCVKMWVKGKETT